MAVHTNRPDPSSYMLLPLREGELPLYRGSCNGLDPILLVAPAAEHLARGSLKLLEHEHALRDVLDPGWAARPVALALRNGRMTLVLEDFGGEPLERMLGGPMDVRQFLHIAVPLAVAVGKMHAAGLIHKDIKPANILVNTEDGGVRLTGFGIASRLPQERQAPAPLERIAGTLAYMAPEQTGRMNRSVDARSDLYSLGITFYEMLTGTLPFAATDPMEWVHCHIARQADAPDQRAKDIPKVLSEIVMKLLAKTAEERYQTAAVLAADLRRCLAEWESHRRIEPFPLRTQDASGRLLIPEKLYGREREIATLLAAVDSMVANGATELLLVSGYSGIGKSSVVNELHKALVPPRGLFASGKFDQFKRDIPYATLAQAFQGLVRSLLGQSEVQLGVWRQALVEALGANGQLIVNFVPELELVIGQQPPVVNLPPQEGKNRFQMVFRRFLGVFARKEHPLALFLDDLQWLDAATLDLIEHLVTHPEVRHLLLIGAYRDNEADAAHPLARTLEEIRKAGTRVAEIVLTPLGLDDVNQFVAETIRCESERARPLAQLIQEKTSGNPFFTIQFITALAEEGLLAFDPIALAWQWDVDGIRAKSYTDNVVDLMVGKLMRLSPATQHALKRLACLGNVAGIATLAQTLGTTEEELHEALWQSVHAGLVYQQDGAYKFLHDRIQQAAYALIPESDRATVHLRIGRVLASQTAPAELEEKIFEIVSQLNRAAALIHSPEEREQVAELNLIAGKRAKMATAYSSALIYFAAGRALLADDCWARRYSLTFDLEFHRAECELLTGEFDASEERLASMSDRVTNLVERAAVTRLRLALYTTIARFDRAIDIGLEYLRRAGIEWSRHPTEEDLLQELERMRQLLKVRPVEQLLDLPLMSNPHWRATMDVLAALVPPGLNTRGNLHDLFILRMVTLSLEHGNCDSSCYAYASLNFILGFRTGDYQTPFRLGQLACDLVERPGLDRSRARVYSNFGYAIPWTKHLHASRPLLRRSFDAAKATGDLNFAAYSSKNLVTNLLVSGEPLAEVQREAERGLAFARKVKFGRIVDEFIGQLMLILTLRGLAPGSVFGDLGYDDRWFEGQLEENPNVPTATCFYWVHKQQADFFAQDCAASIVAATKAKNLLWSTRSHLEVAEYQFYGALARACACDSAVASLRQAHLAALLTHYKQIVVWAENCPENFANRAALVGAEIARLEGRDADAMRLYEGAIRSAHENSFVQNEGLAYEVAARFYAARGFETVADAYLRNARYCYLRWGADGKVRQLDELYPQLRERRIVATPTATLGEHVERLDVGTIVKASQALSSEIELGRLIEVLLRVAIEHAGAERGLLILLRGDTPQIGAEARADHKTFEFTLRQEQVAPTDMPESLLRTVIRTRQSIILDDAAAQNSLSADDYIRLKHARSVLCLPLVKQAKLVGVLYLENNLASHVFTSARISVLELLASQAAISLENARLYNELQERETRIRRLVDSNIIGIMIGDSRGRIIETNEAFLDMLGYSREDLVSGRIKWTKLTPAEWACADQDAFAQMNATGSCKPFEKEYLRKDGSRVPVLIAGAFFERKRDEGVVFVIDMTDRKQAEEKLRRSEAFLAEGQKISRTGSWEWNISTGKLVWSEEHYRIFGFDPKDTDPTFQLFWDRIQPEDRTFVQQTLDTAIRNKSEFTLEFRIILPDGSDRHLYGVGHPVLKAAGDLDDYIGTTVDVTAAKRGEEALNKAQADLAHVTRVTTLGELTASIAHEVNQPLAAVVTNAEACLRWLDRETPDLGEARDAVEWIIKDGTRASEVIRRVRALANKTETRKIPLDINDLVNEVFALVRHELLNNRVSLRTELASIAPIVLADRVQLQQVIINLVINGIEAMRSVTDRPRELVIQSKHEARDVLVTVQDCGVGISAENADHLFDTFFTTKSSGMGMGLSICRSIVEAHGGRMSAANNAGPGATFQFTLPLLENAL